jgi:plasmid stabilization system protein ParE
MSFTVRELPKAKQDKHDIFHWLHERSPAGAIAWLDAYDALVDRLKGDARSFGEALENKDCEASIKQGLFKTSRGRVYRAVFLIEADDVYVLRVRGPGQAPIDPKEIL